MGKKKDKDDDALLAEIVDQDKALKDLLRAEQNYRTGAIGRVAMQKIFDRVRGSLQGDNQDDE